MSKNIIIGGLVLLALAPAYADPITEARFVTTMQRGKAAYDRKDFAASEKAFRTALELQPKSAEALNDLGQSQYRAGQFAEAQKSFDRSGAETPLSRRSRAFYQAGNSLYRQNKLSEAAEAYRQALRANEQDEDARFNLQVVLDKQKEQKPKEQPKDQQDKSQAKPDPSQGQSGKPPEQKDKSQAQQEPSQGQSGQPQDRKDKSQAQPEPSQGQSGQPQDQKVRSQAGPDPSQGQSGQPQARRDEGDRILQYYQDKQSQLKARPMSAANSPRPSEETW